MESKRSVCSYDVEVGQRVRAARNAEKITQQGLGEALGVSFQQVQKYEKGMNRIPPERLRRIAETLKTTTSVLLHGFEDVGSVDQGLISTFFADHRARDLAGAFLALPDHQKAILRTLAISLADHEEEPDGA